MTGVSEILFDVLSRYNHQKDIRNLPIKVDTLRNIVLEITGLKTIAIHSVDVITEFHLGNIKFYYPRPVGTDGIEPPTTTIIRYSNQLNFCWTRFVVAKELCHCLFDEHEDRVSNKPDLKALVEGLASKVTAPFDDNRKLISEDWAELMAIELLYPLELRMAHVDLVRRGEIDIETLARRYRIPREYASLGIGASYMSTSYEFMRGRRLIEI